jgi:hypothetical protein
MLLIPFSTLVWVQKWKIKDARQKQIKTQLKYWSVIGRIYNNQWDDQSFQWKDFRNRKIDYLIFIKV